MPAIRTDTPEWPSAGAELLLSLPTAPGGFRLVAVEGRSGSGKSTVADRIAAELRAPVVRMDDLYPGWEGLAAVVPLVRRWIVEPLRHGRAPCWQRYDWDLGRRAEWRETPVAETLLIEGCGTGAAELRPFLCALVWVETPPEVRQRRLAARWDAGVYAPYRSTWSRQEDAFYAENRPCAHAHLTVDNGTDLPLP
ncbi:nucleoside/nucleotide kinase family protein [Haloactinospora alba]|uniref:hypothetical protein n=1 Tax=Haloactinospora alba TaxID=405555 RepID=UPI001FECA713|nr:hypothetical protein [Haloactinospora alba]